MRTNVLFLLYFLPVIGFGQQPSSELRSLVLKNNITDSVYVFDRSIEPDIDIIKLNLLGKIMLNDSSVIKVLNSVWIWESEGHGTSRIIIYTENDDYMGDYNFSNIHALPKLMTNGVLEFEVLEEGEAISSTNPFSTRVDLKPGLPKCIVAGTGEKSCFKPL